MASSPPPPPPRRTSCAPVRAGTQNIAHAGNSPTCVVTLADVTRDYCNDSVASQSCIMILHSHVLILNLNLYVLTILFLDRIGTLPEFATHSVLPLKVMENWGRMRICFPFTAASQR